MSRSKVALALGLCSLLFGCGGQPGDGEPMDTQSSPGEGTVTASAVSTISTTGSTVSFNSNNDDFTVTDTLADGHSAVARIHNYNTGGDSLCWNTNGANTSVVCARDYAEGIRVGFKACTGEAGTGQILSCSAERIASTANTLK